jgi:hypothetical protein
MPDVPGNEEKQWGVRLGAVAVTQSLVFFVLVSRRRIESGSEDRGVRVGGSCPSVWGWAFARRCIPWHSVRKRVLSSPRQGGGAFSATKRHVRGKTEAVVAAARGPPRHREGASLLRGHIFSGSA